MASPEDISDWIQENVSIDDIELEKITDFGNDTEIKNRIIDNLADEARRKGLADGVAWPGYERGFFDRRLNHLDNLYEKGMIEFNEGPFMEAALESRGIVDTYPEDHPREGEELSERDKINVLNRKRGYTGTRWFE